VCGCVHRHCRPKEHRAHTEGLTAPYSSTVDAALGPPTSICMHGANKQAYAWAQHGHRHWRPVGCPQPQMPTPHPRCVYGGRVGKLQRVLANPWDPAVKTCKQEVQIVQTRSAVPLNFNPLDRPLQAAQLPACSHTQHRVWAATDNPQRPKQHMASTGVAT
jgi:hypothetical protein